MPHLTSNIHLEIAPGLFCALDVAVRCEIVFTDKRGEGCRLRHQSLVRSDHSSGKHRRSSVDAR